MSTEIDKVLILKEIKKHLKITKDADFARFLGIKPQTLSSWYTRNTFDTELVYSKCGQINPGWLLTGVGDMLKEVDSLPSKSQSKGVPYYNVDFIGGFDLVMSDQTLRPDYLIDFQKYNDADCWCNVTGHSMEPEINNGDIIALKEVKEWQTFLPFGEVYGIVTNEHRTIKRVTASTKEGFLKLVPTNKSSEYQPQDIPVSIIIRIFRVLGCVKKF